jgi:hypothetical protein
LKTSLVEVDKSNLHSFANFFHKLSLNSIGDSAESIPQRLMPLKINGKTVVLISMPPTFPQHDTQPWGAISERSLLSMLPPTVSTAPANNGLTIGLEGSFK